MLSELRQDHAFTGRQMLELIMHAGPRYAHFKNAENIAGFLDKQSEKGAIYREGVVEYVQQLVTCEEIPNVGEHIRKGLLPVLKQCKEKAKVHAALEESDPRRRLDFLLRRDALADGAPSSRPAVLSLGLVWLSAREEACIRVSVHLLKPE